MPGVETAFESFCRMVCCGVCELARNPVAAHRTTSTATNTENDLVLKSIGESSQQNNATELLLRIRQSSQ
jgi:hypothetical protein